MENKELRNFRNSSVFGELLAKNNKRFWQSLLWNSFCAAIFDWKIWREWVKFLNPVKLNVFLWEASNDLKDTMKAYF